MPVKIGDSWLNSLLPMLQRLDRLLEQAIATAETIASSNTATNTAANTATNTAANFYQELPIEQVEQWLQHESEIPLLAIDQEQPEAALQIAQQCPRWHWLQQQLGLTGFELDVIVLALAPELDRRYEQIYAYLQNDGRYRRPCVDLTLNLLCASATLKLEHRRYFAANAPLVRSGIVRVLPDPYQVEPSLLSHFLKLDDQIVQFLLGQTGLDSRLGSFCKWIEPNPAKAMPLVRTTIIESCLRQIAARQTNQYLCFYFEGTQEPEKQQAAIAIAQNLKQPLILAHIAGMLEPRDRFESRLSILLQAVWLQDALLYIEIDGLQSPDLEFSYHRFLAALTEAKGIVILSGTKPWGILQETAKGVLPVSFACPEPLERRVYWQAALTAVGVNLNDADVQLLSNRFQLGPTQIADAVTTACHQAKWNAALNPDSSMHVQPTLQDVLTAVHSQLHHHLSALAQKVGARANWTDIVLPIDALSQLREICNQFKYRYRVYRDWGFDQKSFAGQGINVLFSGPPGTGKTMAAGVIANELQLELYRIDLSQVVSKYIGETEKNLDRIFRAAEAANAILLFDEADALFGKRSEIRDAHDRFANIEVSYLLQKMEAYEGIAILTTNLRQNLDEAFTRRLSFIVHFPAPDESSRHCIWQTVWAAQVPLAPEVDLDFLARQLKLNGGNIKNIALAAAFLAAETNSAVTMHHLFHAARREYQKMGKSLSETEWKMT
ncbi:MAG: ATP-binding protein [Leptolyngbya sp. IPPAS B-1204]|nr:MAG: ATP-binding protein [Leptolyngbya sp. IPPAS B-1204]